MRLSKHISDAAAEGRTSLGDNPAFPPSEGVPFALAVVRKEAEACPSADAEDGSSTKERLIRLTKECMDAERSCRGALEEACMDIVKSLFDIPDDTIDIRASLVDSCDMSRCRMTPDDGGGIEFDDVDDMEGMGLEIYKRRMVDALIAGASALMAEDPGLYEERVGGIDPALPGMYRRLLALNTECLFEANDTIGSVSEAQSGKVDVDIPSDDRKISIDAEAVVLPVLVEQVVRGILEAAAAKGLPEDFARASYILGRSDFRLAENWDARLGRGLWRLLSASAESAGTTVRDIGENFLVMEVASLSPKAFNTYLRNVFAGTKKGVRMTAAIARKIDRARRMDDFDNFLDDREGMPMINDGEEYSAEALRLEAEAIGRMA